MMKKLLCAWIALALLLSAACGLGESLFVDNRETDKIYPERLNLRAQPAKNGAILGLYYTGTEVNVLAVENEEYDKVEVGGVTGYMASAYLIPQEEIAARYRLRRRPRGRDRPDGHVDDERDPPRNDGRHERGVGDA